MEYALERAYKEISGSIFAQARFNPREMIRIRDKIYKSAYLCRLGKIDPMLHKILTFVEILDARALYSRGGMTVSPYTLHNKSL